MTNGHIIGKAMILRNEANNFFAIKEAALPVLHSGLQREGVASIMAEIVSDLRGLMA